MLTESAENVEERDNLLDIADHALFLDGEPDKDRVSNKAKITEWEKKLSKSSSTHKMQTPINEHVPKDMDW